MTSQPNTALNLSTAVQCPYCPFLKYLKGNHGLNIHISKCHRNVPRQSSQKNQSYVQQSSDQTVPQVKNFQDRLQEFKQNIAVLRRIPRSARVPVARKLTEVVKRCASENTQEAWEDLFTFSYSYLHVNEIAKGKKKKSLAGQIKGNLQNSNILNQSTFSKRTMATLTKSVENKISDGDVRGAIRLLSSDDTLAPDTIKTLAELQAKHPNPSRDLQFPDPPLCSDPCLTATESQIFHAINSFPNGSAGGMDGLRPQHLKDMISKPTGETGQSLLYEITRLCNLMLNGAVYKPFLKILYGASVTALKKPDGGIRPIAVGSTFRRLVSKLCCTNISETLGSSFRPTQLGFGTKGGCEAAVHSLRTYLEKRDEFEVLLKVDVKNAFNSLERDCMLSAVKTMIPNIYPYLWQAYFEPSTLFYNDNTLSSCVGVQQGDPLGPPIFSLTIDKLIKSLSSEFNTWYLDDGTLAGKVNTVLEDLQKLIVDFKQLGLVLNFDKCEIFINENFSAERKQNIINDFERLSPNLKILSSENLILLGAPIKDEAVFPQIDLKKQNISKFSDRLQDINPHMALFILKHCGFIPKLTYILRTSPIWKHALLISSIDHLMRTHLEKLLNIKFEDSSFRQATLQIRLGGLGVRQVADVALPAFISSIYSTETLIASILSPSLPIFEISHLKEAAMAWQMTCPSEPLPSLSFSQSKWDLPISKQIFSNLLNNATDIDRARILAVSEKESGAWLEAYPSSHLGTLLDKETFRICVSLRVGAKMCQDHICVCGKSVDRFGYHGLSCSQSAGRLSRHATLNQIIRRSLATSNFPSILEPVGISRDDGKRPDGMTLVPWQQGRALVWDATCVDTMAPSHLYISSQMAGSAAAKAENLKRTKYKTVQENYVFSAFAVETFGPWSNDAKDLVTKIGRLLIDVSGDRRAKSFLEQRVSLCIQRGNAASVLGTMPTVAAMDEFFHLRTSLC